MKVMLAIPAYRGIVCPQFVDSLEETGKYLTEMGIDYFVSVLTGCCYIQIARNKLVSEFINSDADKLVFLDDDISWNKFDLVKLITDSEPVTCGVYRLKTDFEEYPAILVADSNGAANICDSKIEATRVPTGFLCVDRSVFETLLWSYPELSYTEVERGTGNLNTKDYFDFFPQGVKNNEWVGEDYAFCDLWTKLGGKIYVYPNMTIAHHSSDKSYSGNYYEYLKSYTDSQRGA